ncbi:MAG: cupin domain-containing protein [Candidatus Riflebacteria bacterium]|nr:cupin domain-containing protein [Candidatus Riflebacteria bacterium]
MRQKQFVEKELSQQARDWIKSLRLQRHPEGGYFAEVYRSEGMIRGEVLPEHGGSRPFMTSIYFMLPSGDVSRFHRLKSDEIWYHHAGGCINIHQIDPAGRHSVFALGQDLEAGQRLQIVIKAGCWFGAVVDGAEVGLVGCAVAPGFDFVDFELADRAKLLVQYPQFEEIINRLT